MNLTRALASSLRFHWRIHAAVALGVVTATAVLSGALIVGDSVRGSLRHLTLDRLGRIEELLVSDHFFRQELATELSAQPKFKDHYASASPAILFPSAIVQATGPTGKRLASGVQILGSGAGLWALGRDARQAERPPSDNEVILNAPLAEELAAKVGDTVVIRFGKADQIPADSPLGRRTDRIATLSELKVIDVIPAEGLGRFGLQPSQIAPHNAYVSLSAIQGALDAPGMANAIFIGGRDPDRPSPPSASASLATMLQPKLEDYGLSLKHVRMTFGEGDNQETIFDYFSLSSDRMLLNAAAVRVADSAFGKNKPQKSFTYLANRIQKVAVDATANPSEKPAIIPYSTIAAIDLSAGGPLAAAISQLANLGDDEIALTSWAADDLKAKPGDRIRVSYFEPETIHGEERETSADFRLKVIVPLTEPKSGFTRRGPAIYDQRPTPFNDPDLTPEVKGITDQATISDWDAPFRFDYKLIRDQDDTYWENHHTTPKAYISMAKAQSLWASRFGSVTSIRIPAGEGITAESLEQKFLKEAEHQGQRLGLDFLPIKRQGLAASSGTTPFDVLFLLLSMFIIAAALMLVWLLFRLGVEQRADEIGLLLALGWSRPKVRRLFLLEGGLVAAIGAALGMLAGVGYAWLMLAGLRSWWIGAIASPFLTLYVTPLSLVIGLALGLLASLVTIWFSLARMKYAVIRSLLAGDFVPNAPTTFRTPHTAIRTWLSAILFLAAIALAFYAAQLGGEAQAGAFMGAGAALLVSLLLLTAQQLRSTGKRSTLLGPAALGRLAFRSAGRNVGRSTATIALVAAATFLIVAVSAFRMGPTSQGVGGFDLIAESSQPIYEDLNSAAGRQQLLAEQADVLTGATVLALRLKAGDDASCRNLYQPTQPRILGVTPQMVAYFDEPQLPARFAWSASEAKSDEEKANPWRLLSSRTPQGEAIPVVLDQNTAMYSLRLYGGVGQTFDVKYADSATVKFRVAGLLANSVLQGSLLIGEGDFQRLFPNISGYRVFLIRSPAGKSAKVATALEDRLGDEGFDTTDAHVRLADLLAVQNTYISTFQSLGALGLVLGTFGLAAVQLRSVFERRKELALMRATGFRRSRLGEMVLLENLFLLIGGLTLGTFAALLAVLPQMFLGGAHAPLGDLAALLAIVLVVGVVTGLIAVRATLQAPLVAALRGE